MPLVRVDVQAGRTAEELSLLLDTIQLVMLDVFAAPPRDRYQILTQHPPGHLIAEDTGLGLARSDGITFIQILQQGRSRAQKQAVYRKLADRLEAECGLNPSDLIISITTNAREDWSFGLGRAQFIEGDLA